MRTPQDYLPSDLAIAGPLGTANGHNNKGRSAVLAFGALNDINGQQIPGSRILLNTQAPARRHADSIGDALAQVVTLGLSYASENQANFDDPLSVRGTIQWGNDGHQMECDFDWRHGTVIRVAGSSFRLTAEVIPSAVGETPTDAICRVGAVIGYAPHGQQRPTLTDINLVGAGASILLPVPPFASQLELTGPIVPRWFRTAGTAITGFLSADTRHVPQGANFVELLNTDAAPANLIALWLLDL